MTQLKRPKNNSKKILLLIHTMTITQNDYTAWAEFVHTFNNDDIRFVGQRIRIHPTVTNTNRIKRNLHRLTTPSSVKHLIKFKANAANIKHHLRTVHLDQNQEDLLPPKQEKIILRCQQPSILPPQQPQQQQQQQVLIDNSIKKNTHLNDDQLMSDSTPEETINWLTKNRFEKYLDTFSSFSGADMLRMSRDDLLQICGHADGIRLYNAVHLKPITPKLKIYICRKENANVYNAIFLSTYSNTELIEKLALLVNVSKELVHDVYMEGPKSIRVKLANDVICHIKEETMFSLEMLQENGKTIFLLKR